MKLVGFGFSHIISIRFAADVFKFNDFGININTILLSDTKLGPLYSNYGTDCAHFSDNFRCQIDQFVAQADVIFLCIAGNAHQILGLVNHPIPFDFVLEHDPSLSLLPEHEIIPSKLVAEGLTNQGGFPESIKLLKAFRAHFNNQPIIQCALPPIIPSLLHISKYSGIFKELIDKYGVAPESIRYKLWNLHSYLIKSACERLDIQYLQVPSSMIDHKGFLVEEAWPEDATHANHIYGSKVIEQLIQSKKPSFSLPK